MNKNSAAENKKSKMLMWKELARDIKWIKIGQDRLLMGNSCPILPLVHLIYIAFCLCCVQKMLSLYWLKIVYIVIIEDSNIYPDFFCFPNQNTKPNKIELWIIDWLS